MKKDKLDKLLFSTFILIMTIGTVIVAAAIPFMVYGMIR